ncbi:MAG TPA: flagellar hook-associated protein FlgK [bacterium]
MSDLLRALDIARRALHAQQSVLNTTSNNIANANTEGYSRQRVNLSTSSPQWSPYGLIGTGVNVDSIERIRDVFVDRQIINERQSFKQYEFKSDALQFIEEIFNEPSDMGLSQMLKEFFAAFHDLANDPDSTAARTVVRERAMMLSSGFKRLDRQLNDYRTHLNYELQSQVDEVNRIAGEIAHLNEKIVQSEVNGLETPTLRDSRDRLVDQLSGLVNIQSNENEFGAVSVSVGGRFLVVETSAMKLSTNVSSLNGPGPQVVWEQDGEAANITNGQMKGILDIRDNNITSYLDQVNQFAVSLADSVNNLHRSGYNLNGDTNVDFFKSGITGAADFDLSADVQGDVKLIATADATGEPGNNGIALAIAGLEDAAVMEDGQRSFDDFYSSLISTLGAHTQEAAFLKDSFELTVNKLEFTRESISGVSLDEEMTNLIEAQQAYTAAARLVTTIDEMMQTVLDMV